MDLSIQMKFAPGQDRGKTSKKSMHTQPKIEAGTEILHLGWKGDGGPTNWIFEVDRGA